MAVIFNSEYYIRQNPDVAAAIAAGVFESAEQHFQLSGQFENRSPSAFFDPNAYLRANPDVAAAIQSGALRSAFEHFSEYGSGEARDPGPFFDTDYYLTINPDVAAAVERGEITAFEHFQQFGLTETREVSPFFDLAGYLSANPDVAAAVQSGAVSAFEHFTTFGFTEGRDLGNGISLEFFANDPVAQAAIEAGDFNALFARVAEVAPFISTFEAPTGYTIPADQPLPTDFVPPAGQTLVVPEGVTPPAELPPGFEQPTTPPVTPPVTPPTEPPVTPPVDTTPDAPKLKLFESLFVGGPNESVTTDATNDRTPTLAGVAQANATVQIFESGKLVAETTAGSDGRFSATLIAELEYGSAEFTATATVNGKVSAASSVVSVNVVDQDVRTLNGAGEAKFYNSLQEAIDAQTTGPGSLVTVRAGAEVAETVTINKQGLAIHGGNADAGPMRSGVEETLVKGGFLVTEAGRGAEIKGFTFADVAAIGGEITNLFVDASQVRVVNNIFANADDSEGRTTGLVTTSQAADLWVSENKVAGVYDIGFYFNPLEYARDENQVDAKQAVVLSNIFENLGGRTPLVVEVNSKGSVATVGGNDFTQSETTRNIDVYIRTKIDGGFDVSQVFQGDESIPAYPNKLADTPTPIRIFTGPGVEVTGTDANERFNPLNFRTGESNVTFNGGGGNDILNGGAGNDRLLGGAGNDILNGRAGQDILSGGEGSNTFIFATGDSSIDYSKADVILDFTAGQNAIQIVRQSVAIGGSEATYSEASFAALDYEAALGAASAALVNDKYYNFQWLEGPEKEGLLFIRTGEQSGANEVIRLVGVDGDAFQASFITGAAVAL